MKNERQSLEQAGIITHIFRIVHVPNVGDVFLQNFQQSSHSETQKDVREEAMPILYSKAQNKGRIRSIAVLRFLPILVVN